MHTYETPVVLGTFEAGTLMGEALGGAYGQSCEYDS